MNLQRLKMRVNWLIVLNVSNDACELVDSIKRK